MQVVNRMPKSSKELLGAKGYDTISEAMAVADDGDFILLLPGTYNEGVFLAKSLSIFVYYICDII